MSGARPIEQSPANPARRDFRDARGFSLVEAVVATVIAVIAALGLAYTFGIGRGNVNRFEAARMADARAQGQMEYLAVLLQDRPNSDSLKVGGPYPAAAIPVTYHGAVVGTEYWRVEDAPATVPAAVRPNMSLLTVEVAWSLGGVADTARYTRLIRKAS
jgi:Tfp pilus assembly protein PilV